jgi:hypothetical protein
VRIDRRGGVFLPIDIRHPSDRHRSPTVIPDAPDPDAGRHAITDVRFMPDPLDGSPLRYLRTPEAARFVGLSIRTSEKHRTYGTGPRYSKLGGRVVYRRGRWPRTPDFRQRVIHRMSSVISTPS